MSLFIPMKYLLSKVKVLTLLYLVFVTDAERNIHIEDCGETIFVNVITRHGARTPDKTYKNDPHKDAFPGGLGELTNAGKRQQYELGKWLRQRYNSLLTATYSPELIYVMSSDTDRVLMSAQCSLAGMYPPEGHQVWNKDLDWQPIPVHTVPKNMDKILAMKASCPEYTRELENVLASDEIQKLNKKYKNIVDILNKNTGENRNDYKYISQMYDTLKVQSEYNLDLPEWSKEIFPQKMKEATVLKFSLPTWNNKLSRLIAGPLLQELISNMETKIKNKSKRVMHMYVGHDSTIINLLNTLGAWDKQLPPYSACVMLELRRDSRGDHFVKLFYYTSDSQEPRPLEIPGCDRLCPLDDFINITKPAIPEDWQCECNHQK